MVALQLVGALQDAIVSLSVLVLNSHTVMEAVQRSRRLPLSALPLRTLQALASATQSASAAKGAVQPPECTVYQGASGVPGEVLRILGEDQAASAGAHVRFVLRPEHVGTEERLQRAAWAMMTFHAAVDAHVKATRAFLHTRTRRRVHALMKVCTVQPYRARSVPGNCTG